MYNHQELITDLTQKNQEFVKTEYKSNYFESTNYQELISKINTKNEELDTNS